jgi:hypothetical protein
LSPETAEMLGYAGRGLMKWYVAVPGRPPSGELIGCIGRSEAKLPKRFHIPSLVTFPQEDCLGSTPRKCGVFSILAAAVHSCPRYR